MCSFVTIAPLQMFVIQKNRFNVVLNEHKQTHTQIEYNNEDG